jgi:hypothetical protein
MNLIAFDFFLPKRGFCTWVFVLISMNAFFPGICPSYRWQPISCSKLLLIFTSMVLSKGSFKLENLWLLLIP